MKRIIAVVLALLLLPPAGFARPTSGSHRSSSYSHSKSGHSRTHSRSRSGLGRARHGRIKRSAAAKNAFKREHPCPSTGKRSGPCRGYVIDHIKPLACGGADDPSNMQWQTVAEGKAKDKWERNGCN